MTQLLFFSGQRGRAAFVAKHQHQPAPRCSPVLRGLLDEINSDSYDLLGASSQETETDINMADAYEMFLADLVFSTNDPRVDIMN